MNKRQVTLGIDTSNYTTSLAVMSTDGELLLNSKELLSVKEGERGLRQSDALFLHTKNLPKAFDGARDLLKEVSIRAIGVSERPRNVEGSYMPCFLSGVSAAVSLASALSVPLYRFSHQCGHIMAALYSSGRLDLLDGREFTAFHVSGGTTEVLRVKACESGFKSEIIGGTRDLNAGQVIDRIGVLMGLTFPAGEKLEALALTNTAEIPKRKPALDKTYVNLSGLENILQNLYRETHDKALVASFLFEYIGNALLSVARQVNEIYGEGDFIFAGGVMSNSIIKNKLKALDRVSFAEPRLSSDNAVGTAYLALSELKK